MISKTTQILKKHEIAFAAGLAIFIIAIALIYPAKTANIYEYFESKSTALTPNSNILSVELIETEELPIENAALLAN